MIRPVRGWLDSAGVLHATREDACRAEFRRLLAARFTLRRRSTIAVDDLVAAMFDIDKMIGQASKEDSRADFAAG